LIYSKLEIWIFGNEREISLKKKQNKIISFKKKEFSKQVKHFQSVALGRIKNLRFKCYDLIESQRYKASIGSGKFGERLKSSHLELFAKNS
jgi:hypothetical protein